MDETDQTDHTDQTDLTDPIREIAIGLIRQSNSIPTDLTIKSQLHCNNDKGPVAPIGRAAVWTTSVKLWTLFDYEIQYNQRDVK